jgi:hypothetical protein
LEEKARNLEELIKISGEGSGKADQIIRKLEEQILIQ